MSKTSLLSYHKDHGTFAAHATRLSSIWLIVHKLVHFPVKSGCCLTLSLPVADLLAANTYTHCAIG